MLNKVNSAPHYMLIIAFTTGRIIINLPLAKLLKDERIKNW